MLFTSLYLIGFMIVLFGLPFAMPSSSSVCTRFWMGFSVSYLYYYWCSRDVDLGTITFTYLRCLYSGCTYIYTGCLWRHFQLFTRYNSLPQHQPILSVFGTIWVDTIYDLEVFSPGVDITVAGCQWLVLGAFRSHTGCLDRSFGNSLAWASCPAYSCLF